MGFRINTNVPSLSAQRNLGLQRSFQDNVMAKLSSGERITKAADDAAGLAISEKLKAEIRSNRQAARNTSDGISMIQTAEGGLNEISNILVRLRELSIQSASDTVGDAERGFTDLEVQHLKQEVSRIAEVTKFNGIYLLNGSGEDLEFQVGTGSDPEKDRMVYKVSMTDSRATMLGIDEISVSTKQGAQMNLDKIDKAIMRVSENRASLGALQNRLTSTFNNLQVADENLSSANSRIRDADIAWESAELAKRNILTSSGTAVLAQANNNQAMALKLLG
jgi:flagellin